MGQPLKAIVGKVVGGILVVIGSLLLFFAIDIFLFEYSPKHTGDYFGFVFVDVSGVIGVFLFWLGMLFFQTKSFAYLTAGSLLLFSVLVFCFPAVFHNFELFNSERAFFISEGFGWITVALVLLWVGSHEYLKETNSKWKLPKLRWVLIILASLVLGTIFFFSVRAKIDPRLSRSGGEKILDYAFVYQFYTYADNRKLITQDEQLHALRSLEVAYDQLGLVQKMNTVNNFINSVVKREYVSPVSSGVSKHQLSFLEIDSLFLKGRIDEVKKYLDSEPVKRVYAAIGLAEYYFDNGQDDQAANMLQLVGRDISIVSDQTDKDYFLERMSDVFSSSGNHDKVAQFLEQLPEPLKGATYCIATGNLSKAGDVDAMFMFMTKASVPCRWSLMSNLGKEFYSKKKDLNSSQLEYLEGELKRFVADKNK